MLIATLDCLNKNKGTTQGGIYRLERVSVLKWRLRDTSAFKLRRAECDVKRRWCKWAFCFSAKMFSYLEAESQ